MSTTTPDQTGLMRDILAAMKALQQNQIQLAANVDAINGRVNILAGIKEVLDVATTEDTGAKSQEAQSEHLSIDSTSVPSSDVPIEGELAIPHAKKSNVTSRIILT
jgi:hypothetical protein